MGAATGAVSPTFQDKDGPQSQVRMREKIISGKYVENPLPQAATWGRQFSAVCPNNLVVALGLPRYRRTEDERRWVTGKVRTANLNLIRSLWTVPPAVGFASVSLSRTSGGIAMKRALAFTLFASVAVGFRS